MEYKKLQEKYDLPKLESLKKEFFVKFDRELGLSDVLDNILGSIGRIAESFEGVMTGEGFSSVFEASMLSVQDKNQVFEVYKTLKSLMWEGRVAMARGEEKEIARLIRKTHDVWSRNSHVMADISKKLSDGWRDLDVSKVSETRYHV